MRASSAVGQCAVIAQPRRLVGHVLLVEGGIARGGEGGEAVCVARGRDRRRVRREGPHVQHERGPLRDRFVREADPLAREHVRQVVLRAEAVAHDAHRAREAVAEALVAVAGDCPVGPPRRHVRPAERGADARRRVLVEVLAHQRRAVADALQVRRVGVLLQAVGVEREEAAVGAGVAEDPGVVRVLAGEDRRARRAAQRVRHEVVREARAAPLQAPHVRHVGQQVARQVVGQDEDDVRLRRRERLDDRAHDAIDRACRAEGREHAGFGPRRLRAKRVRMSAVTGVRLRRSRSGRARKRDEERGPEPDEPPRSPSEHSGMDSSFASSSGTPLDRSPGQTA